MVILYPADGQEGTKSMSGATLTPPKEEIRSGGGSGLGDAAHIVVMNDNHNTFEGVAFTLAAILPGVDFEKGMAFANTIHRRGQARVWSGSREVAELYHEQLTGAGLTVAPLE